MVASSPLLAQLSPAERAELESRLVEFDLRWDENRLPAQARELPPGGPFRLAALAEMTKIDLERRWQRGDRVTVEHYLCSFPELGSVDCPPLDIIETEVEVRTLLDVRPDEQELRSRFPGAGEVIRELLAKTDRGPQTKIHTPAPADRPSTLANWDGHVRELSGPFGRYHIRRCLGRGGMGAVYLADDTQLARRVALKVPHTFRPGDAEARERFRREGRAAAALDHPHLCRVYDVGEHEGIPYLTMAYIEGHPLNGLSAGPLSMDRIAGVVRKVALALAYAHAHGVVHRDLKPSNILIDARGEPVVTDFGLARREGSGDAQLSQDGVPLGTPAYMSPEQVTGRSNAIGPASDIFSLGIILYQLLAGQLPFRGGSAEVMVQIAVDRPAPPSSLREGIDKRLEGACLKAMAKEPAARFASMDQFAAALVPEARAAAPRKVRRALVAGSALLAIAAGVVVQCNQQGSTPDERSVSKSVVVPDEPVKPVTPALTPPPRPAGLPQPVVLRGNSKGVTAVGFAPEGRVVSAEEKSIRLWDPHTGMEIRDGKLDFRAIEGVTFSPDGRRFASHALQPIELRERATGKALLSTSVGGPHTGPTAFSANGKRLVAAKMEVFGESVAIVWDFDANKIFRFRKHVALEMIAGVALSADGTRGASASKDGVRVWEVESANELRHWQNLPVAALAFTPDGGRVLTGSALGALVLRDPATGKETGRFDGHTGAITALAFSADGALLLSASTDGTARLWSAETRQELHRLEGHTGAVSCAALSPDGARALTGGTDGTVRVWALRR